MNANSLHIDPDKRRFGAMIGTGGIGAGSLFLLSGDHTLGREESRGGKYLDARDYCKLHIISHYVKVFCGTDFPVFPIGKIGDDDVGRRIFNEMRETGLNMEYVKTSPGDKTLFGFCFLYPDGTGGNLTTEESACSRVDPNFIRTASPLFSTYQGKFIALSVPEVPMKARRALLTLAKQYGGFSVASFTSGEMKEAETHEMLSDVDLLAINVEEAAAFVGGHAHHDDIEGIVEKVVSRMNKINPHALLSVTAGIRGSWIWDGQQLSHAPAFPVEVKSSAGAGDAHVAGIISGLTAGLTLSQAQILGSLAGAFAVTSQHTIHPEMTAKNLKDLALRYADKIERAVVDVLDS